MQYKKTQYDTAQSHDLVNNLWFGYHLVTSSNPALIKKSKIFEVYLCDRLPRSSYSLRNGNPCFILCIYCSVGLYGVEKAIHLFREYSDFSLPSLLWITDPDQNGFDRQSCSNIETGITWDEVWPFLLQVRMSSLRVPWTHTHRHKNVPRYI